MKTFKKNLFLLLFILCFSMSSLTVFATEIENTDVEDTQEEENEKPFESLDGFLRDYKNRGTKEVNIREEPSTSSDILITLPVGEKLSVLDQTDKWFKVKYNDISGYVFWKYIGFVETDISGQSDLIGNSIIHYTSS